MKKLLLLILFVPILGTSNTNAQGTCSAMFQFTLGMCPDIMFFDGSQAGGPMATIVSWDYDFGDGSTDNVQNPTHTYTQNGTFTACLTITDSDSCVSTFCQDVIITCLPNPTCDAAFQYTLGLCPDIMFFDGSTTTSGTIVSWEYDFGDGGTSTDPSPTHTYTSDGNYFACLTITTSDSCVSTYCDSVMINCSASLGELNLNNLILSPNPAKDFITLKLEAVNEIEYRIFGLNGIVQEEGIKTSSSEHSFDISGLAKGVYLIEIEIDGVQGVTRFVKE